MLPTGDRIATRESSSRSGSPSPPRHQPERRESLLAASCFTSYRVLRAARSRHQNGSVIEPANERHIGSGRDETSCYQRVVDTALCSSSGCSARSRSSETTARCRSAGCGNGPCSRHYSRRVGQIVPTERSSMTSGAMRPPDGNDVAPGTGSRRCGSCSARNARTRSTRLCPARRCGADRRRCGSSGCSRTHGRSEPEERAATLRRALALWRGQALADWASRISLRRRSGGSRRYAWSRA